MSWLFPPVPSEKVLKDYFAQKQNGGSYCFLENPALLELSGYWREGDS